MSSTNLRPASFRGVPFLVEDTSGEFGRRTVLHEYPGRDIPYGEDMGRAARRFSLTAFFIGSDAQTKCDAFIDALEAAGPGTLIHPFRGSQFVQLANPGRLQFPRYVGGKFVLAVEFVEAGQNREPEASQDVDAQLQAACDDTQAACDESLEERWLDDIGGALDGAAAMVDDACRWLEGGLEMADQAQASIDRIIMPIQRIITSPMLLATRLKNRIDGLTGRLQNPFTGLSAWKRLLGIQSGQPSAMRLPGNPSSASKPTSTPPYVPPSLATWMRQTGVITGAAALPSASFSSRSEIIAARALLLEEIDSLVRTPKLPLPVFESFSTLRAAVVENVAARLPGTADTTMLTTRQVEPSLVVAYRATGSIASEADLVARNGIRHPGFLPAGTWEVIK